MVVRCRVVRRFPPRAPRRVTGERHGYYAQFGDAATLARAIEDGSIRGPHPARSRALDGTRHIVSAQTHDQIGNRALGERLDALVGAAGARLAAVAALAAVPAVPLLFMGEEWGATSPFLYFTSHGDPEFARNVDEGRRREFPEHAAAGDVPGPQEPSTFAASRLDWSERARPPHAARLALYRDLLALRKRLPALAPTTKARCHAIAEGDVVRVERGDELVVVINLSRDRTAAGPPGWQLVLSSEDARYGGALGSHSNEWGELPPRSAAIFTKVT